MNFSEIKKSSKEILKTAKPSPVITGMLLVVVMLLLTYLAEWVLSGKVTENDLMRIQNLIMEDEFESAMTMYERIMPSNMAWVISAVIEFMKKILATGFVIFLLNTVRKTGNACYGNLLDGFAVLGRLIVLLLLEGLFIMLWSFLLIIPGIIAAFSYSQALYIMLDNPDKSIMQCIKESKAMMKGHKWNYFVFNLSFIGWYILEMVPVARIWTKPYIGTAKILYYDKLCGRAETSYKEAV